MLTSLLCSCSFFCLQCVYTYYLLNRPEFMPELLEFVLNDSGNYLLQYVPKELLPIYRDKILPLADIVTPNQYEAE